MGRNVSGRKDFRNASLSLLCAGLLAAVTANCAYGQASLPKPEPRPSEDKQKVAEAVARVKSGNFEGYDVVLIGEAGAVEAIPALESQFTRASEQAEKAKDAVDVLVEQLERANIAEVLLYLGDKKDIYWDFLVELARPALESDAPNLFHYDANGKGIRGPSPEWLAWAKAHPKSAEVSEGAIYMLPGAIMLMGASRDPRAIPLLRQALFSQNDLIASSAAKGLAELQDEPSVPFILERCKTAPADAAMGFAQSLVYFDDPDAQKAVDTYLPKDVAKAAREFRKMGRGPFHGWN